MIIDDGRGLIVEQDNRNFHILKLTTQYDKYKRKLLKNWKELVLKKKSYFRMEIQLKIKKGKLIRKITSISAEELLEMYNEIYKILNINALEKMSKKYNESKKDTVNVG